MVLLRDYTAGKWIWPQPGEENWQKACDEKIFQMMKKMLTLDELLFKTASINNRLNVESERAMGAFH